MEREDRRRLLLPLTYGFSVRYALPTGLIERLAAEDDVVVGLGWTDPELVELLERAGARVVDLPRAELTHDYRMFRRRIGMLRDRRLDSPTSAIRLARQRAALHNRRELAISVARRWRDQLQLLRPGGTSAVEAAEEQEVERGTNVAVFRDLLDRERIDAVLSLTPYHDQDALLLWAARSTGRPSTTSIISFDNPTTRERLLVRSERILVWNRFNEDELLRSYPDLRPEQVEVVGAPQFDLHHRADLRVSRDDWCTRLGLPTDRPIILYGAGPSELVPQEQALVGLIDRWIDEGRLDGEPFLLVRRHPVDPEERWAGVSSGLRHGVVVDPWGRGPDSFRSWPTTDDLELQMSTLAHAEVHVHICSSMTLDGAVFDRPQIGPTFVPGAGAAELRRIRDFTRQEHWQPIARSGGLASAHDEAELAAEIGRALSDPSERADGRRKMVRDVLTFDDGASTERLADRVVASGAEV